MAAPSFNHGAEPTGPGATAAAADPPDTTATLLALHGQSLTHDYRRQALWAWLEPRLPRRGRVLDAGCGTGFMTWTLARHGYEVTAIDPDEELVAFTRQVLATVAPAAHVARLPLGEGQLRQLGRFDGVLCLDVIEHIEDDLRALTELRETLQAGGTLLLSVPAMPSLYGQRDRALGHYRRYGRRGLMDVCRRASLRIDELRYWNALGVPAYFVYERLLRRPIADGLRTADREGSPTKAAIRAGLARWLRAEARLPVAPPVGLSLLAVCRAQ